MENLKNEVRELTEWNNHLEARLLIAKRLMPEYLGKYKKFVEIDKKMIGFTPEEIRERENITKAMFAELVTKIGLKQTQDLYGCL